MTSKRFILTALAAAVLALGATPAAAISVEEIVTLTKLGISPDEVIKAITKDKTVFELGVKEILALKKANIDEKVLKFMLQTKQLWGKKDPATDPGKDPIEVKPIEPTETPEEKAAREERMREEARRLLEEKSQAEAAQAKAFAQGVLARGQKLANDGKFVESIQAFQQFVAQGNFAPDSDEAYLAKYGEANALVKAGLYQSAAKLLVEILLAGTDKPFFQTAFRQLRTLRKKVNYSPPDLEELTKFFVTEFSEAFQSEFNYVLGEFYYDYNNWTQALKYLEAVSPSSNDFGRAQYLKGLVEVRNQLYASAAKSFQGAIVATEENGSDPAVRDLSFLALARVAYEYANDFDAAIYYYKKVPKDSYKQATALYEAGWVYFLNGDASRALGTFHVLHSPYFDRWFYPELWLLEATTYMNLCQFDLAEEAANRFKKDISPLAPPLKQFLLKTVRPEEYFNAIVSTAAGKQSYGLSKRLIAPVLANVEFYNLYQTIKQIRKEQRLLGKSSDRLGTFGSEIMGKLQSLESERTREIGIKVQNILKATEATLADYELKLKELEVDLQDIKLEWEQDRAEAEAAGETYVRKTPKGTGGGSVAIVGADSLEWSFEGEYWKDAIGYYRAFVRDQCVREEAAAAAE